MKIQVPPFEHTCKHVRSPPTEHEQNVLKTTVFNDYLQIAQSQRFGGTKRTMAALKNDLNILH